MRRVGRDRDRQRAQAAEGRGSSWSTVNLPKIGPLLRSANRAAELALGSLTVPALTPGQISAIDAAHIWHPYSTIGAGAMPPVVAVGARGAWLTVIDDGHPIDVLDAMSSWLTAIHGHAHPTLDAAITEIAKASAT